MKKKLLALALVSMFALGACTDGAGGGGTGDTAGPADTGAVTTAIAPTTAAGG